MRSSIIVATAVGAVATVCLIAATSSNIGTGIARSSRANVRTFGSAVRMHRNVVPNAKVLKAEDAINTGILSANQQYVFISERQLKSATQKDEPAILPNIEKLGLLSGIESSGLLSVLDKNGITLSFIENLGLLSTAENLGLLSVAANPETPAALFATSVGLALVSTVAFFAFPDDNAIEATLKTALLLAAGGGTVATAAGGQVLSALQGKSYTKVGTGGGNLDLENLVTDKGMKQAKAQKRAASILPNLEKLKLLSQVERSGILSKLEGAGFSLAKIEKLKLLSTTEKAKVLSTIADTDTPGKLVGAAAVLAAAAAGLIVAVPDTDPTLIAAQAAGAAALGLPAAGALYGSSLLGSLQKK